VPTFSRLQVKFALAFFLKAAAPLLIGFRLRSRRNTRIVLLQRRLLRRVKVVQGAGERCVRFERVDVQHPRLGAVLRDERRSFLGQERWFGTRHRYFGREVPREGIGMRLVIRFVSVAEKEVVIGAAGVLVTTLGIVSLINAVFDRAPLLKSALRENF